MLYDERFPDRPQHPDFWRMVDATLEGDAESQVDFTAFLRRFVDHDSLVYLAQQRVLRALQTLEVESDLHDTMLVVMMATWMDGWIVGCGYEKRGGHQDDE